MSRFSTYLPVEEIHMIDKIYTILFKADKVSDDNNFKFEYKTNMDISKFNIKINQIDIVAKYLNVSKRKVMLKDENLNLVASFEIPHDKILTIRKYNSGMLSLSIIGFESYWYIIKNNEDKIVEKEELKKLNMMQEYY